MRYILVLGEPRTVDLVGQAAYRIHKSTGAELHVYGCPVSSAETMPAEEREKIACVVVDEAGERSPLAGIPVIDLKNAVDLDAAVGAALLN